VHETVDRLFLVCVKANRSFSSEATLMPIGGALEEGRLTRVPKPKMSLNSTLLIVSLYVDTVHTATCASPFMCGVQLLLIAWFKRENN
jgi:hypothetical protein